MKTKIYKIVLNNGEEIINSYCTSHSLPKLLDQFIDNDWKTLFISSYKTGKEPKKKIRDSNKVEKERYYNTKYSMYYKRYKDNKIEEKDYKEIKETLKRLKNECKTKREFVTKFEKYKKTLNI